jgi:hypothetical protein
MPIRYCHEGAIDNDDREERDRAELGVRRTGGLQCRKRRRCSVNGSAKRRLIVIDGIPHRVPCASVDLRGEKYGYLKRVDGVVDRVGEGLGNAFHVRVLHEISFRADPQPSRALLDLLCTLIFDDSFAAQVARFLAVTRAPAAAGFRAAFGCDSALALGFWFHWDPSRPLAKAAPAQL